MQPSFRDWALETFNSACPLSDAQNYRAARDRLDIQSRKQLPERREVENLFTYVCRLYNQNKAALLEIGKMAHAYPALEKEIRASPFADLFYDNFQIWVNQAFGSGSPLADCATFRAALQVLEREERGELPERTVDETLAEYVYRIYVNKPAALVHLGTAFKYGYYKDWTDEIRTSPYGSLFFS